MSHLDLFPLCHAPAEAPPGVTSPALPGERPCLLPALPGSAYGRLLCLAGHDYHDAVAEMAALERRGGVVLRGLVAGWVSTAGTAAGWT